MISKTTGRYVAGTMVALFLYEVLDSTGIIDRAVRSVTNTLGLR